MVLASDRVSAGKVLLVWLGLPVWVPATKAKMGDSSHLTCLEFWIWGLVAYLANTDKRLNSTLTWSLTWKAWLRLVTDRWLKRTLCFLFFLFLKKKYLIVNLFRLNHKVCFFCVISHSATQAEHRPTAVNRSTNEQESLRWHQWHNHCYKTHKGRYWYVNVTS